MTSECVLVTVRVRPAKEKSEREEGLAQPLRIGAEGQLTVNEKLSFNFDQVFGPDSDTQSVYDKSVAKVVSKCLKGTSGSVLAYGATGSGKTHTMAGGDSGDGLMSSAVAHLLSEGSESLASLHVSILELYNETIVDLLADQTSASGKSTSLAIGKARDGTVIVPGRTEVHVSDVEAFRSVWERAQKLRTIASTALNAASSRSHCVVMLAIQLKDGRKAKLNLIDLAGSEDNRLTGNTGARMQESGSINSSLFVLGRVIDALNEKSKGLAVHVPYRESKLTRLLQDSLGGGSAAVMVCCVAPEASEASMTLATVSYGSKARSIVNHLQATVAARAVPTPAKFTPAKFTPAKPALTATASQTPSGDSDLDKLMSRLESWKKNRAATPRASLKTARQPMCLSAHDKKPLQPTKASQAYHTNQQPTMPPPPQRTPNAAPTVFPLQKTATENTPPVAPFNGSAASFKELASPLMQAVTGAHDDARSLMPESTATLTQETQREQSEDFCSVSKQHSYLEAENERSAGNTSPFCGFSQPKSKKSQVKKHTSSSETESFDLTSALLSPAHMLGSALKSSQRQMKKPPVSPLRASALQSAFVDELESGSGGNIEGNDDACDDNASVGDDWNLSAEEEPTVYMEPAEEEDGEEEFAGNASNECKEGENVEEENDRTMQTTMPPSPVMSSAFVASPKLVAASPMVHDTIFERGPLAPKSSSLMTMDEKANTATKGVVAPSFDAKSLHGEVRQLIELQVVELLNHGSLDQLLALHGIGPKRAQYILEFRETHASEGGFANIHELKLVGMPTKQIHKIARMLVNQQLGAF